MQSLRIQPAVSEKIPDRGGIEANQIRIPRTEIHGDGESTAGFVFVNDVLEALEVFTITVRRADGWHQTILPTAVNE